MWKSAVLAICVAGAAMAQGGEPAVPPPEDITAATLADGAALARLQSPGRVFFTDDFETASSLEKYFEIGGLDDDRTGLTEGGAQSHSGAGAIRFTAPARGGQSSGVNANVWFGPQGYETVYFRRYIKFAADYDQGNLHHTGGGLAGVAGHNKWGGMGQAGIRPTGDDRFTASFEPWRDWRRFPAPGYMFLYTYWMDMEGDRDGNYWGNFIEPPAEGRIVPEPGRWYCLEQMIKVNDLGQANGEMAAWIDGELYLHFRGFRWRTAADVKIKRATFGIYIHHADKDNTAWYDDVALSTGYIGPLPAASVIEDKTWGQLKSEE